MSPDKLSPTSQPNRSTKLRRLLSDAKSDDVCVCVCVGACVCATTGELSNTAIATIVAHTSIASAVMNWIAVFSRPPSLSRTHKYAHTHTHRGRQANIQTLLYLPSLSEPDNRVQPPHEVFHIVPQLYGIVLNPAEDRCVLDWTESVLKGKA